MNPAVSEACNHGTAVRSGLDGALKTHDREVQGETSMNITFVMPGHYYLGSCSSHLKEMEPVEGSTDEEFESHRGPQLVFCTSARHIHHSTRICKNLKGLKVGQGESYVDATGSVSHRMRLCVGHRIEIFHWPILDKHSAALVAAFSSSHWFAHQRSLSSAKVPSGGWFEWFATGVYTRNQCSWSGHSMFLP